MNMQYAQAVMIHERSHRTAPAGYLSVSEANRIKLPTALFTSYRCTTEVAGPGR